ncbi:MAG: TerD family protein [Firmicutes bacterium]|nr:TerD family protein [Bacillota bacterium]
MESKVVERDNTLRIPVEADAIKLSVELGWDPKAGLLVNKVIDAIEVAATGESKNAYDLDLAAIIEYSNDKKADLIFHGQGFKFDKAESVVLGADSRTGLHKGVNERITVHLARIPAEVKRILFFVNIHEGEKDLKYLGDVANAFIQIQSDERSVYSEMEAFKSEDAKDASSLVFAALVRDGDGWVIQGMSRYGAGNDAHDVYEGITGAAFR